MNETALGDLVTLKRGYDLPKRDRVKGKYPIVSSSGITGTHNDYKVDGPGVVTGRYGTLGEVYYILERFWPLNTSLYVQDFKGNDPRFISYYLDTVLSSNFNAAGAVPGVNRNALHKLKVPTPPKDQQKIAAILSAYDELIENNRRRIAILERMAEEIYREWFVRMRFPGHEQAKFHKGVPEGWEVKPLRKLMHHYIGGGWGEEDISAQFGTGAYVIRGTDIPSLNSGEFSKNVFRYHKASNYASRKLSEGDIIFEASGGSKNQLLGRSLLVTDAILEHFDHKVMCASFCKLMRFDRKQISPYFMKYFFHFYYETGLVGTFQVQSTGISNYQFESFLSAQTLFVPTDRLLDEFDTIIKPILDFKDKLAQSYLLLQQTRDRLLTRLLSSKLAVDDLDIRFPPGMVDEA